jgi:cyclic pyranopterin phosphate synthase
LTVSGLREPGDYVIIARGVKQMKLSHVDEHGHARMVDVGQKPDTQREAVAKGCVLMQPETLALIQDGGLPKGDVLAVAQVAGLMAAKRTHELVPMCHPLLLTHIGVEFEPLKLGDDGGLAALEISATVRTTGKTGVEMEALTAVAVAGLTIYDMCKAVDRGMRLEAVRLVHKSGGKSGDWSSV